MITREDLIYFGKRLTKKYYIIGREHGGAGFFSNYMWVLAHVIFAVKHGFVPVVDMEHFKTLYSEEEPIEGTENAWNYYFENVSSVTLQEAYESGRYLMSKDTPYHDLISRYCEGTYRLPTAKAVAYYAPLINRFLKIRPDLKAEMERRWMDRIQGGEESGKGGETLMPTVLGVHVRGTDMKNNLGHPMPAPGETYWKKVCEILEKHPEIDTVFLATDEVATIRLFQEESETFANSKGRRVRLIMNDSFRAEPTSDEKKTGIHELAVTDPRDRHKYLLGLEVLEDAYDLSRCDYLLCGHSNITNVVLMWNNRQFREAICIGEHLDIRL